MFFRVLECTPARTYPIRNPSLNTHIRPLMADLRDKLPCDSDPGEFSYALDSGSSPEQPADSRYRPEAVIGFAFEPCLRSAPPPPILASISKNIVNSSFPLFPSQVRGVRPAAISERCVRTWLRRRGVLLFAIDSARLTAAVFGPAGLVPVGGEAGQLQQAGEVRVRP